MTRALLAPPLRILWLTAYAPVGVACMVLDGVCWVAAGPKRDVGWQWFRKYDRLLDRVDAWAGGAR